MQHAGGTPACCTQNGSVMWGVSAQVTAGAGVGGPTAVSVRGVHEGPCKETACGVQGAPCWCEQVPQGHAPAGVTAKGRWACALPGTHLCPSLPRFPIARGRSFLPSRAASLCHHHHNQPVLLAWAKVGHGHAQGMRGAGQCGGSARCSARAQGFQ